MEPEGSLPHSQEPAACPYPEPAQLSPTSWIHNVVFATHLRPDIPIGLFCSGLCAALLSPICVRCSGHLILLDLMTRIIFAADRGAHRNGIVSTPLLAVSS